MARKRQKRANGQYEVKITVGHDYTGKAIRKSFYSSDSIADAKRKAEIYKRSQETEKAAQSESVRRSGTFSDWAAEWLRTYKQPFVSEATYRSTYEAYVYNHMVPFLGRKNLRDITQADVQRFFAEKADKSDSFLRKCRFMFTAIFDTAIENELCERNPAKRVRFSSTQQPHEKKALSDEQIEQMEKLASGIRPEVILFLHTGLRRGELCGLQWADIDFDAKTLHINRAIAESGGKCRINPPKFESYRTIPLDNSALNLLQQLPQNSDWVFPAVTGGYRRPDKWTAILERFVKDLPPELQCTSHDLRHTYGSWLRRHGVDIYTIQQVLGHKDINVTAGTYVHADMTAIQDEITRAVSPK